MARNSPTDDTDLLGGDDNPTAWFSHPIDIRLSLPFLRRRLYFTLVAGEERRRADRLKKDRQAYPLITSGNIMFTLGITTLFCLLALGLLIAQSAIIE